MSSVPGTGNKDQISIFMMLPPPWFLHVDSFCLDLDILWSCRLLRATASSAVPTPPWGLTGISHSATLGSECALRKSPQHSRMSLSQ